MSELSLHQKQKFEEILFLLDRRESTIVIKGSAGVGKTFLTDSLIKFLEKTLPRRKKILCSAPTHKALSVLRRKITVPVKFNTIHSTLQYKPYTNPQDGTKEFISMPSDEWPPLQNVAYWIIDEASMIDIQMLINIEYYAKKEGVTVIFIGDDKQINPVKEEESWVFIGKPCIFPTEEEAIQYTAHNSSERIGVITKVAKGWVGFNPYPSVELTEIVRQGKGNPIINLSRNLSKIWDKKQEVLFEVEDQIKGYLYTYDTNKIIVELAAVNGTDELKYLAWTNEEVDRVNDAVRKTIYGPTPNKIELGETIVFDEPYGDYTTNQEVKVESVYRTTELITIELEKGKRTPTVTEQVAFNVFKVNEDILILDESSEATFRKYAAICSRNCTEKKLDYVTRNKYLETFAKFKYNHALTVHKAQGSTYKTTIINVFDINKNSNLKEKTRLLYTGVTRSSDLLILYNVQ